MFCLNFKNIHHWLIEGGNLFGTHPFSSQDVDVTVQGMIKTLKIKDKNLLAWKCFIRLVA